MTAGLALAPAGVAVAAPVPLTSSTELSGSSTGYVPVTLDRAVRVSGKPGDRGKLGQIQSDGLVAGALLRQEHEGPLGPDDPLPPSVAFWRADPEAGEYVFGSRTDESGEDALLSPGPYRLYLITDGSPARVTLNLEGLQPGHQSLRPAFGTPASIGNAPQLSESLVPRSWILGGERHATSAGWLTAQLRTEDPGAGYSRREICTYSSEPTQDDAYARGCPGGDSSASSEGVALEPGWEVLTTTSWTFQAGRYGIGANVVTDGASSPPPPQLRVALLSFDPPTPLPSPDVTAPDAPPHAAEPAPLPQVLRRGIRGKASVTIALRCSASRRCEALARAGRWPSRPVRVAAHRTRRYRLRATTRAKRITIRLAAVDGPATSATRVALRAPRR